MRSSTPRYATGTASGCTGGIIPGIDRRQDRLANGYGTSPGTCRDRDELVERQDDGLDEPPRMPEVEPLLLVVAVHKPSPRSYGRQPRTQTHSHINNKHTPAQAPRTSAQPVTLPLSLHRKRMAPRSRLRIYTKEKSGMPSTSKSKPATASTPTARCSPDQHLRRQPLGSEP